MSIHTFASLRFPVSLAAGLVLTGTLYWTLWALTDKSFDVIKADDIRIEFTRVERDERITTKDREPKVEREPPEQVIDLPRITETLTDDVVPAYIERTPPAVAIDGRITMAGADRDAVPLVRVEPTYPPRAAANNQEGWVRVQFDIAASGAVTNVSVVESEPGTVFDDAAEKAVARWRYNPSIVEGKAVERIGMQTIIRFNLQDE